MLKYDFLDNNFTTYESVSTPTTTIKTSLFNLDIDWGYINPNGAIIANNNLEENSESEPSKLIVNNNDEVEITPQIEEYQNSEKLSSVNMNKSLKEKSKLAIEFFKSKGLKEHQAAGIVGNLIGESSLNYTAVNPKSKAYGIALWLGDRKKKLFSKYGNNPSFEQQLEFIWEELNTVEKNAFNRLLQTQSIEEATNSFMKHFERPSQREMALSINNRIKYAKSSIG